MFIIAARMHMQLIGLVDAVSSCYGHHPSIDLIPNSTRCSNSEITIVASAGENEIKSHQRL